MEHQKITIVREVRDASNTTVITLGPHIAAPLDMIKITIEPITSLAEWAKLNKAEKEMKEEYRRTQK